MRVVVYNLETDRVGCSDTQVYRWNPVFCENNDGSINEDYLRDYGYQLARDNAEMYGILDEDDGCDPEEKFYETHEIINFATEEEAIEAYDEILEF